MPKTMTISEVIRRLKEFQKIHGDIPVFLQQDTEGNGYGTLKNDRCFFWTDDQKDKDKKILLINPYEEHLDYNDLWKD